VIESFCLLISRIFLLLLVIEEKTNDVIKGYSLWKCLSKNSAVNVSKAKKVFFYTRRIVKKQSR